MTTSRIFVGSSKLNLQIARIIGESLEELSEAEVTVWHEGIFGLGRGVLESLLASLDDFDFAVLVLAADDAIVQGDHTAPSPRDNVLFECGLFMGRLGRDRVFVSYDESVELKLPSDLAGITLAPFDGARMRDGPPVAAVRKACRLISEAIKNVALSHLVGHWVSRYCLTAEHRHPFVTKEADIIASAGGVCINHKAGRTYGASSARAHLINDRFLVGKWKAAVAQGSTSGAFLLSVTPRGNLMYGYASGVSESGGIAFVTWVLAKRDGADEDELSARLQRGEELLKSTFTTWNALPKDAG